MSSPTYSAISIFVIATKSYVNYALTLIETALKWHESESPVQFILLTDRETEALKIPNTSSFFTIDSFQIPSYGWPEATLLRFHLMLEHWSHVSGSIVMYLDADTKIVAPLNFQELSGFCNHPLSNGITHVLHPGYYKRSPALNLIFRTRFGPWENNQKSTAYIPSNLRKNYVCGAVFWGLRDAFHQLCVEIKLQIDKDSDNKVVAKWHDESHLNKWLTTHPTVLATPEWAYAPGYRNLRKLQPRIEVVHKPSNFIRTPTDLR
jgi:hypothetical protein